MKYYLITIILTILLSACSSTERGDKEYPDLSESGYINLSFKLMAHKSNLSRTDEANHDEIGSEWSEFEDRIYADDFAFYIYAVFSDGTNRFLLKVDNLSEVTDPYTNLSVGGGNYTLRVSMPKEDFEKIVPASVTNLKLKIVTFANTKQQYKALSSENYNTYENLISAASGWTYNIFEYIYSGTGGTRPNPKIPMFGVNTIEVTRDQLYKSGPNLPIEGGSISLLRSVAKIKVIDNIPKQNESGYPKVDVVEIFTLGSGYILPYNAATYPNGYQVEIPYLVEEEETNRNAFTLGNQGNEFFGYIPEQGIIENLKFKILVDFSSDPDSQDQVYQVPLTGYAGKMFEFGDNILRNHIYTLSVDNISDDEAEISVTVEEWNEVDPLYIEYSKTVTMSEPIYWEPSTYESKTPMDEETVIVLKPNVLNPDGYIEYPPLMAFFEFLTPMGATWTATLLPIQGEPVITFTDYGGDEMFPTMSGEIPGGGQLLIVSRQYTATDQPNIARLQIVVKLANGTVLEMPSGFGNYLIVQNPQ